MTLYVNEHVQQYDYSYFTRVNGCTWTSGANGVRATTGGRKAPSPDYLHSLLPRYQETSPTTPGWSIPDLRAALSKYGMSLVDRSGKGWYDLLGQLDGGHYCVVQGDSDQFGNATCSGAFDGDHAVGIHPRRRISNGYAQRWIDDPICPDGRWEYEFVLRRYASKLNPGIQYGAFFGRVPTVAVAPAPTPEGGDDVAVRYVPAFTPTSRMELDEGQRLYESPGGKSVTRMSKAGAPPHLGLTHSPSGKAWRAVVVATRWNYPDGKAHRTVLYVPSSAGEVVKA